MTMFETHKESNEKSANKTVDQTMICHNMQSYNIP